MLLYVPTCRAEFRVWHDGTDSYYIMFQKVISSNFDFCCSQNAIDEHVSSLACPLQPVDDTAKRHDRVRIDLFPVGSVLINELMMKLLEEVQEQPVLKTKLYQVSDNLGALSFP